MTFAKFRYDFWAYLSHNILITNEIWLGAESNRRHVDFQSTALPTELPSRLPMKSDTNSFPLATVIDFMLTFPTASANICDHEATNP
jgi:hypothetical protein